MSKQKTPVRVIAFSDTTVKVIQAYFKVGQEQSAIIVLPKEALLDEVSVSLTFINPKPKVETERIQIAVSSNIQETYAIANIPFKINKILPTYSVKAIINIYSNCKLIYQSSSFTLESTEKITMIDHEMLTGKGFPDQHPISSITSLSERLLTTPFKTNQIINTEENENEITLDMNKIIQKEMISISSLILDDNYTIVKITGIDKDGETATGKILYASHYLDSFKSQDFLSLEDISVDYKVFKNGNCEIWGDIQNFNINSQSNFYETSLPLQLLDKYDGIKDTVCFTSIEDETDLLSYPYLVNCKVKENKIKISARLLTGLNEVEEDNLINISYLIKGTIVRKHD